MPSLAPLAATIRSHASAISRPPATAKPSIAAISGLREARCAMPAKPRAPDERAQVHAGAEEASPSCEHPDRELVVGVELVQRAAHALRQRGVDRVSHLR